MVVGSERGQGTVEYLGAVLVVAVLLGAVVAVGGGLAPGSALGRAVAGKLVCAVRLAGSCDGPDATISPLELAYGSELAAELAGHAPRISFERGEFASLPVDFRRCRARSCADTSAVGDVRRSFEGERPTAFTRVVDCRPESGTEDAECSGEREGKRYLQFWLYYPDSLTRPFGRLPGRLNGYHEDDWESYLVRIGPDGSVMARASSHKGYNGGGTGPHNALSDIGRSGSPRWGAGGGHLRVAQGSHAGSLDPQEDDPWRIDPRDLRLVPLEPLLSGLDEHRFAVSPPWRKRVWRDPEWSGTD